MRSRSRPRQTIIMKKYQIMINNIRFKIITGKINKIPRILHFCTKNARLHNNTTRSRPGRGQTFEVEAEAGAKASRPRPKFWLRIHFGFEDLTWLSLQISISLFWRYTYYITYLLTYLIITFPIEPRGLWWPWLASKGHLNCQNVCISQSDIASKRRNMLSKSFHHSVACRCNFLDLNN